MQHGEFMYVLCMYVCMYACMYVCMYIRQVSYLPDVNQHPMMGSTQCLCGRLKTCLIGHWAIHTHMGATIEIDTVPQHIVTITAATQIPSECVCGCVCMLSTGWADHNVTKSFYWYNG